MAAQVGRLEYKHVLKITTQLGVAVLFAVVYKLLGSKHINAGSEDELTFLDALYFSFTVSSTVGFGDFGPRTPLGKGVVIAQQAYLLVTAIPFFADMLGVPNL